MERRYKGDSEEEGKEEAEEGKRGRKKGIKEKEEIMSSRVRIRR